MLRELRRVTFPTAAVTVTRVMTGGYVCRSTPYDGRNATRTAFEFLGIAEPSTATPAGTGVVNAVGRIRRRRLPDGVEVDKHKGGRT